MRIEYTRRAEKELKSINEPMKTRIQIGIEQLPAGDISKLSGHKAHYRLRIGDYRVVFEQISEDNLLVTRVAPRGQVYKGA